MVKGVGRNSILCTQCGKWIHKRCSGVKGSLEGCKNFKSGKCLNVVASVEMLDSMAESATVGFGNLLIHSVTLVICGVLEVECRRRFRCQVSCAWGKFNEFMPILTMRGTSLKVKGKIYKVCVQSVMMYGSETWAMKVEDTQKLKRTEASMMRRMCGVSLEKHLSNEALRGRQGIDCVSDLVRRSRRRWFGHVVRKDDQ